MSTAALDLSAARPASALGLASAAARLVVKAAFGTVVLGLLTLVVGPRLYPFQTFYIRSASMSPAIPVGALVVAKRASADELRPGAVIVFERPDRPGMMVVHRIEAIETRASGAVFLNAITTGQTTVSLVSTSGPWTVEGQSYNYRASLTASNPLSAGAKTYTIAATDHGGHTTPNPLPTNSVTVDNTAPTATGISTGNASGGNHGTAEIGDTITFTFSERIDPYSIVSGWVGTSSTNVVVELIDGGCGVLLCTNDSFKIYNSAYSATLPFGTTNLGSGGYYGSAGLGLLCLKDPTAFGASGTPSTMVQSTNTITITLGTRSGGNGSVNDVGGNTDMSWDSTTTPYDAAGNSASGNTYTEGDNDFEF